MNISPIPTLASSFNKGSLCSRKIGTYKITGLAMQSKTAAEIIPDYLFDAKPALQAKLSKLAHQIPVSASRILREAYRRP